MGGKHNILFHVHSINSTPPPSYPFFHVIHHRFIVYHRLTLRLCRRSHIYIHTPTPTSTMYRHRQTIQETLTYLRYPVKTH